MSNERSDEVKRPIDRLVRLLRDWHRGFTDDDMVSAEKKISSPHRPGAVIPVSIGELKAIIAMQSNAVL